MRWALAIAFVIALAVGDLWIEHNARPPIPPPVAARDLAAGTLLEPADLVPAPPVGRYARSAVAKGKKITDLTDAITLTTPAAGDMIVGLPVERTQVAGGAINAGAQVTVCRGATPAAPKPETVRAVACPATAEMCTAMIEAPAADVAAFAAPSPDPILLHRAGAAKPCW